VIGSIRGAGLVAHLLHQRDDAVEHRDQVEVLEDEAEIGAAEVGRRTPLEARHVRAEHRERARARMIEAAHHVEQRALAAARRADEGRERAAADGEAHLAHGGDGNRAVLVGLAEIAGDDDLHARMLEALAPRLFDPCQQRRPALPEQSRLGACRQ
jgi:hypothetical protein